MRVCENCTRFAYSRGRRVIIQLEYLIAELESKEKFILAEIRTRRARVASVA